jgi:hypothetical protein
VLRGHEDDPTESALALRLMGAVNRLVLEGAAPELADLYADEERDPDATWDTFAKLIADRVEELRQLVKRPVQTNEVGRCAALLPGFLSVAGTTGLPLRLLELGSSAGLNLRWDRYRYEAGDFSWGSPECQMTIAFELDDRAGRLVPPRGGETRTYPAHAELEVAQRWGCDPSPLDPATEEGRLTLLTYVWPDQRRRVERTLAAVEAARATPVRVDRAGAGEWIAERLAEASPGVATVVFHSIVMQYLSAHERDAVESGLCEAGARATAAAPLAWLRLEPAGGVADIRLTVWPGGEDVRFGAAGYHGDPVHLSEP